MRLVSQDVKIGKLLVLNFSQNLLTDEDHENLRIALINIPVGKAATSATSLVINNLNGYTSITGVLQAATFKVSDQPAVRVFYNSLNILCFKRFRMGAQTFRQQRWRLFWG